MRPFVIVIGLIITGLTTHSSAKTAPRQDTISALREHGQKSPLAYELVESLTTEIGPRLGGSPNDARAVAWAQATLKRLGFDRIHTEAVTFPRWVRGNEQAEITAPFPHKLAVTALGGSGPTPPGGLQAEIIAFANLEQLKKAGKKDIAGKIVFVNQPMPRFRDGHGYGQTVGVRYMASQLTAEKGGKAVLIRSIATDNNRLPHTGIMKVSPEQPGVPAAALSVPDAILLDNMLKRNQPVTVKLELGSHWDGQYTSQNVLGDIIGSEKPDEFVLLACHLDSWDLGTGAIDDGSCGTHQGTGTQTQTQHPGVAGGQRGIRPGRRQSLRQSLSARCEKTPHWRRIGLWRRHNLPFRLARGTAGFWINGSGGTSHCAFRCHAW